MGRRSMTPVIGVLDDCDRPEAAMLVVIWGNPRRPQIQYINPRIRPLPPCGSRELGQTLFTPLAAFGMGACMASDGALMVSMRGASVARYPDGVRRHWQGQRGEIVRVRPQLAGPVIKAVQANKQQEAAHG
jgi:hypothetical protein